MSINQEKHIMIVKENVFKSKYDPSTRATIPVPQTGFEGPLPALPFLSGVGFFSLCLVASFPLDHRESWPDKRNKASCWQASPLQQSHGNKHHPPRKTTHLARLLAAFVAGASDMGLR